MAVSVKRNKNNREEMKKRVIAEASRAFGKYGIKNVHMDDLSCALSMSKRTLYELFCDKEQLLLEVFIMHQQEMNAYISEIASKAENALEVIFAFYKRKLSELTELNPLFLRDLRKYPNVLAYIRERQKQNDAAALIHYQKGVEEGIFRDDINFDIINQAISMQFEMFIYSDITENYPLSEIYSEVTFLHMRGITTPKGMQMVDAFLQSVREKQ